jgi:hypothetical protein
MTGTWIELPHGISLMVHAIPQIGGVEPFVLVSVIYQGTCLWSWCEGVGQA